MKLNYVKPNEAYPLIHWVSDDGSWEMGAYPVMYGVRVGASRTSLNCYSIDYCAGSDGSFIWELVITIHKILSLLPETITPRELEDLMPTYKVRPIDKDPCWTNLQKLLTKLENEARA